MSDTKHPHTEHKEKRCETCGGFVLHKWSRFCECCRAEMQEVERSEGHWFGGKKII